MENQPKEVRIVGLSSAGTLAVDAGPKEIEQMFEKLGILSTKADIALIMAAAEIGCNEHVETITGDMCARIVGLHIFSGVLVQYVSEQPLLEPNAEVVKDIARLVREEMQLLENACNGIVGLSAKGRKTFQKSVTEFLIQTFASNLPGFSVGISEIIKRHG